MMCTRLGNMVFCDRIEVHSELYEENGRIVRYVRYLICYRYGP